MSVDETISFFCANTGISVEDIYKRRRDINIWKTRYMVWLYLHTEKGVSANALAKKFGRNRPSVFRGIRVIKREMEIYRKLRNEYETIVKKIEGAE